MHHARKNCLDVVMLLDLATVFASGKQEIADSNQSPSSLKTNTAFPYSAHRIPCEGLGCITAADTTQPRMEPVQFVPKLAVCPLGWG